MNNDVLNLNRFGRYLVTDIKNAISKYGITLLVMTTLSVTGYLIAGLFSTVIGSGWHSLSIMGRSVLFGISMAVVLISSPARIYGFITDKKEGSSYLTVPVSSLEKTISMVIVCCIVVPFVFFAVYFSFDQIICLLDRNCGQSILYVLNEGRDGLLKVFTDMNMGIDFELMPDLTAVASPWLYMDDMAQASLTFLLGALLFKSSKPAKTIGCMILISIVLSMITIPVVTNGAVEKFKMAAELGMTPQEIIEEFPVLSWMVRHATLVDTISDTIVNVGLFLLIWLRVKRIKH